MYGNKVYAWPLLQAPLILAVLLSRLEIELDESMGGLEGMLKRQCNTFTISIDKVRLRGQKSNANPANSSVEGMLKQ